MCVCVCVRVCEYLSVCIVSDCMYMFIWIQECIDALHLSMQDIQAVSLRVDKLSPRISIVGSVCEDIHLFMWYGCRVETCKQNVYHCVLCFSAQTSLIKVSVSQHKLYSSKFVDSDESYTEETKESLKEINNTLIHSYISFYCSSFTYKVAAKIKNTIQLFHILLFWLIQNCLTIGWFIWHNNNNNSLRNTIWNVLYNE